MGQSTKQVRLETVLNMQLGQRLGQLRSFPVPGYMVLPGIWV